MQCRNPPQLRKRWKKLASDRGPSGQSITRPPARKSKLSSKNIVAEASCSVPGAAPTSRPSARPTSFPSMTSSALRSSKIALRSSAGSGPCRRRATSPGTYLTTGTGTIHNLGRNGSLEDLDFSVIDNRDFLEVLKAPYTAGGGITWSETWAYNSDVYPEGNRPTIMSDFYDTEKFPRPTCLGLLPSPRDEVRDSCSEPRIAQYIRG